MERVLVCGVTGGIGFAIAEKLLTGGMSVVGTGKREEKLEQLKERIHAPLFSSTLCDMTDSRTVLQCVKNLTDERFDWVIFSAGHIDTERDFLRQDFSEIQKTFQVNTLAVMQLTQALLPHVSKGVIVISSTAGLRGNKDYPVYSSSKAAVNTFTQALARAYPDRVFISVCPGPTNTRMRQETQGDAEKHQSPSVIADVVSSILGESSEYRSGDILSVRNGATEIIARID